MVTQFTSKTVRVLHLCRDRTGGAGRMARALHRTLLRQGVDSRLWTQEPGAPEPGVMGPDSAFDRIQVHMRQRLDRGPLVAYPHRTREPYSPNLVSGGGLSRIRAVGADVIHLHWLGGGYLSVGEIARLPGPVLWTLHDMWPFTGGCHYSGGCAGFERQCGRCPVLGSPWRWDLSTAQQRLKARYARRPDMEYVAISGWMRRAAQASQLLGRCRGQTIFNGVDVDQFRPRDRATARHAWGIPEASRVVLFGAVSATADRRKGYDLLQAAGRRLAARWAGPPLQIVVFGADDPKPAGSGLPGVGTRIVGPIREDESLNELYAAADVVAVPSRQEGFGLVTAEAMASGTPVVAFRQTGADDLIEHRENGWLAQSGCADALADGIQWLLTDEPRRRGCGQRARERVCAQFSLSQMASAYRARYHALQRRPGARVPPG